MPFLFIFRIVHNDYERNNENSQAKDIHKEAEEDIDSVAKCHFSSVYYAVILDEYLVCWEGDVAQWKTLQYHRDSKEPGTLVNLHDAWEYVGGKA